VSRSARIAVLLTAVGIAVLNAPKPLVIDDPCYVSFARHIAAAPLDPYGFDVFWHDAPEPANHVLAPPVLVYWLAGATAVFGDSPLLWKLSLFPFALVLAASLHFLLARFARGVETPLLWMTMASPAVLPALNLMLDLPALGLGLGSLCLFIRACDRGSVSLAALAGLVAGVAMQTKYTSVTTTIALVAWAAVSNRWLFGWIAGSLAACVFVGWECFTLLRYGDSHFVFAATRNLGALPPDFASVRWLFALLSIVGATLPVLGLLALVVLRASRRRLVAASAAVGATFAVIPLLPGYPVAGGGSLPSFAYMRPELPIFVLLGAFVVAAVGAAARRTWPRGDAQRVAPFLGFWVLIELVAAWGLSPFPAARRILGLGVAMTLLLGHLLTRRPLARADRVRTLGLALAGTVLGLVFFVSDFVDASAHRDVVARLVEHLDHLGRRAGQQVWFTGHWGFQFYAERAGMRPAVPDATRLQRGDWLLVANGIPAQTVAARPGCLDAVEVLRAPSPWPWSTHPSAYYGPLPIRSQPDSQLDVSILVAKASCRVRAFEE